MRVDSGSSAPRLVEEVDELRQHQDLRIAIVTIDITSTTAGYIERRLHLALRLESRSM